MLQTIIENTKNSYIYMNRLAIDHDFAVDEARRIYSDSRGMYKVLQARAKRQVISIEVAGYTLEKPYKIVHGREIHGCASYFGEAGCGYILESGYMNRKNG